MTAGTLRRSLVDDANSMTSSVDDHTSQQRARQHRDDGVLDFMSRPSTSPAAERTSTLRSIGRRYMRGTRQHGSSTRGFASLRYEARRPWDDRR
jgi:hypothetical protein